VERQCTHSVVTTSTTYLCYDVKEDRKQVTFTIKEGHISAPTERTITLPRSEVLEVKPIPQRESKHRR
jgi:hypothetical protein